MIMKLVLAKLLSTKHFIFDSALRKIYKVGVVCETNLITASCSAKCTACLQILFDISAISMIQGM